MGVSALIHLNVFWSYNEQDKFSSDLWNNWASSSYHLRWVPPPQIQLTPPHTPKNVFFSNIPVKFKKQWNKN